MLHGKDYAPLQRRMYCPNEEDRPPEEIVRGYELAADKIRDGDGRGVGVADAERSRTIEILEFIDLKDVDPSTTGPTTSSRRRGREAYWLLVEVLYSTGKAGLASPVSREREHLVVVRAKTAPWPDHAALQRDILPRGPRAERDTIEPGAKKQVQKEIRKLVADFAPRSTRTCGAGRSPPTCARKPRRRPWSRALGEGRESGARPGPPDLVAALREAMHAMKKK
jgi:DNA end-binding protein Ku